MSDADTGRRDRAAPPALRLRCVADRDGVRVVSRRRLDKVVPPSEPIEPSEPGGSEQGAAASALARSGFWLEVRDRDDRVRYRRVIPDPRPGTAEVPHEDGSFTQRPAEGSVVFSLLVPDLEDADHVTLLGPTSARGRRDPRTGEVARLALRDRGDGAVRS